MGIPILKPSLLGSLAHKSPHLSGPFEGVLLRHLSETRRTTARITALNLVTSTHTPPLRSLETSPHVLVCPAHIDFEERVTGQMFQTAVVRQLIPVLLAILLDLEAGHRRPPQDQGCRDDLVSY